MTTPRLARHQALKSSTAASAASASAMLPDDVAHWLGRLANLVGIPVHYLVPDARMLPVESIRFFALDPNWIAALLDGALSVGASSEPTKVALTALRPTSLAASGTDGIASGFLLRSAIVADWPGLRVAGYPTADGSGLPLPILRLERLAPTVQMAIFSGLVNRVDLAEPAQHLHFGVGSEADPAISLRWIDAARAGSQLPGDPSITAILRTAPGRAVLDVEASVAAIKAGLAPAYAADPVPHLGAAALALQMAVGAQSQSFRISTPKVIGRR